MGFFVLDNQAVKVSKKLWYVIPLLLVAHVLAAIFQIDGFPISSFPMYSQMYFTDKNLKFSIEIFSTSGEVFRVNSWQFGANIRNSSFQEKLRKLSNSSEDIKNNVFDEIKARFEAKHRSIRVGKIRLISEVGDTIRNMEVLTRKETLVEREYLGND